jgi:PAT family acetyl-CoA transporter-like MFS transporter 1
MEHNEELQNLNATNLEAKNENQQKPNLKGDYRNVLLLLMLYTAQGIPAGIILAIPILLQNRGVSYRDQAGFSFSTWPFAGNLMEKFSEKYFA